MIKILWSGNNVTMNYAARELKKYLDLVTNTLDYAIIKNVETLPKEMAENQIVLGLLEDLGLDSTGVEIADLDDLEDVKIVNGSGYIAGSNPRSVLFGVYDYFKAKGCAWPRPGINGEKIVRFDPMDHEFTYRKLADTRYRGECLEGGVKYEHVRATILWAPKVHMNMFYIQYPVPRSFMSYWYTHFGNTRIPSEELDYEGLEGLVGLMQKDAYRCGLQLQALGHGYHFLPYGVSPESFNGQFSLPEEAKKAIALVNGKREYCFDGVPNYTQVCMGNEEVLNDLVQWLADYAENHPEVNFLRAGLADAYDNHCECPLCTPQRTSDHYVKMLNMLDKELTKRNLDTRVVFSCYVDTLWAPEKERFENPDRFVMSNAMTGRDYNKPYDLSKYDGEIPKWERNQYQKLSGILKSNFPLRRKMINEWRKVFPGDSIFFEYHFYTMHYNDPGTLRIAKNYYDDLQQLKKLGMKGMVNCQTQRVAFPSAFHIALVGESLFDLSRSYEELEKEYFSNAFGDGWETVIEYLTEICDTFDSRIIGDTVAVEFAETVFKPTWFDNKEFAEKLKKVPQIIEKYRAFFTERFDDNKEAILRAPKITYHFADDKKAISRAYKLLDYHCDYCEKLGRVYYEGAMGNIEKMIEEYYNILDWISSVEMEVQYEFDLRLFKRSFDAKIIACQDWVNAAEKSSAKVD